MEVTDGEMRQRFQIGTEEGPAEGLDVPPQGDGPEVDNCWFWFANGGYFSKDYPVNGLSAIQSRPLVRSAFCPKKIDLISWLTLHPGYNLQ